MSKNTVLPTVLGSAFVMCMSLHSAAACTFDGLAAGTLAAAYPGSMTVAVAVANAKHKNLIEPTPLSNDLSSLKTVSSVLKSIGARLDEAPQQAMTPFYVLLVDYSLWTNFYVEDYNDGRAFNVFVHSAAPANDATPVLLTSFEALAALERGEISARDALASGILQIHGDDDASVQRILETGFGTS